MDSLTPPQNSDKIKDKILTKARRRGYDTDALMIFRDLPNRYIVNAYLC